MRCRKFQASPLATLLVLGMLTLPSYISEHYHPLHEAAQKGDLNRIEELIEQGVDVDIRSRPFGYTPLDKAIEHDQLEAAILLIKFGADVDARVSTGGTTLVLALDRHKWPLVSFLIKNGADVNYIFNDRWTPFYMAISYAKAEQFETIKLFVEAGAQLTPNENGDTPLHFVSDVKIAEYLIALGVDPNAINKWGETPYYRAKSYEKEDVAAFLKSKGAKPGLTIYEAVEQGDRERIQEMIANDRDVNIENSDGQSILFCAVEKKDIETARLLIELGADFEKTPGTFNPLILAVEQGNKPMVELLLQNKNVTELKHPSPMNVLKSAILKGDIPIIDLLISKGIDVNVDIDKGWSPFEASLHGENMDVVKFLIKQGADIHKDAARNLAFAYNREMVEFLLNKGVDINARDKRSEKTALQMAITSQIGKRAKLLIKKGADIHGRTEVSFSSAKFPFVLNKATLLHLAVDHYPANNNVFIGIMEPPPVKVLLENGAEVNAADEGVTPLHLSVRQENIELIQLLIDFGAKVDVRDKYGHTPLYWARTLKKDDVVDLLMKNGSTSIPETEILRKENCESLKKVKAFYNSGGNIKARGIYGETALHLAAVYGNSEVVEWLIKQGLDVNAQTWGKHTPLHRVANVKSAELLLEHGAEINQKDLWGFTPLTWAVFWNNEDVSGVSQELVKLFVNSGSDVNVAINADQSILEIAKMISQQSGDTTVVDYLIAHGAKE